MPAFRVAVVAIAGVLASFGIMYAICMRLGTDPSAAVLAAALAVGLARKPEGFDPYRLLARLVMLPVIALAAALIGRAFHTSAILGAALFTGAFALSVWLRNFGARGSAAGRVIALPLIVILVVPVHFENARGPFVSGLLVIGAGVAAFVCTALTAWLGERLHIVDPAPPERSAPPAPAASAERRMSASTRMALQMLVALALAFGIGLLAFPAHWSWVVLTAFIVTSGALGRGDAIYKGLLRLGGAIGGTLVAALAAQLVFPNPQVFAAVVFAVLFAGIWLRQINYAYWAACATLIFALLQGASGAAIGPLFAMRVVAIVAGALCGVAATWFVMPIRTEQIVRRRVADAVLALRDIITRTSADGAEPVEAILDRHVTELQRVAPPVRLHRVVFRPAQPDEHPATWIDLTHDLIERVRTPGFDRAQAGADLRRLGALIKRRPEA